MTRFLFFLGLMFFAIQGFAQNQVPDMFFYVNFSPISSSPSNSVLWGEAEYYRLKYPPLNLPGLPTYTNRLELYINLPTTPKDTRILEKRGASFTPVTEIQETLKLTPDQIRNLVKGNWYVEVDFGTSNYLGQLAPQYNFAPGPKAVVTFPAPYGTEQADGYIVISPNNHNAEVYFDGSQCIDPFYLPMQYSWEAWSGYYEAGKPVFISNGLLTAHVFMPGAYTICLQANDRITTGEPLYFYLTVVTAGQAVNSLISTIQGPGLSNSQRDILVRSLSSAMIQFNQGHMAIGCADLETYEKVVRELHFDNTITSFLTRPAQDVIDAFNLDALGRSGVSVF